MSLLCVHVVGFLCYTFMGAKLLYLHVSGKWISESFKLFLISPICMYYEEYLFYIKESCNRGCNPY